MIKNTILTFSVLKVSVTTMQLNYNGSNKMQHIFDCTTQAEYYFQVGMGSREIPKS